MTYEKISLADLGNYVDWLPFIVYSESGQAVGVKLLPQDCVCLDDYDTIPLKKIEGYKEKVEKLYYAKLWNEEIEDFSHLQDYEVRWPLYLFDKEHAKKPGKILEKLEEKIVEVNEVPTDIPIEESTQTIEFVKPEKVKEEAKKVVERSLFDPIPKMKNDGSLRDEIIKKCFNGMGIAKGIAFHTDILGRSWSLDALKEFKGSSILINALVEEGYPPYISNADKEELEEIDRIFMEQKGRKAFE